jgi:Flp pilus assembly protein TadD
MHLRAGKGLVFAVTLFFPLLCTAQRGTNVHPCQIQGVVKFTDDRPAPLGTLISLESAEGGVSAQAQTDRRGKFEFTMLAPSQYMVYVHLRGYEAEPQVANLMGIPTAYMTFVLKPDPSATKNSPVPPEGPGASVSAVDANAPEPARKDFESGRLLLEAGKDVGKSIEFFKKAIAKYPEYSQAYFLMGVAYSTEKKWDDAQPALAKSVSLNPANSAALVALGSVENEKRNYADAEKHLLEAVKLAPESAEPHFELGRSYWGLSNWTAADEQLTKANQLRPDNAEQHILLGNVKLRERNAPGALTEFKEALRISPDGPMAEPTRQIVAKIEAALNSAPRPQ